LPLDVLPTNNPEYERYAIPLTDPRSDTVRGRSSFPSASAPAGETRAATAATSTASNPYLRLYMPFLLMSVTAR
jgi:hypothetical protein